MQWILRPCIISQGVVSVMYQVQMAKHMQCHQSSDGSLQHVQALIVALISQTGHHK